MISGERTTGRHLSITSPAVKSITSAFHHHGHSPTVLCSGFDFRGRKAVGREKDNNHSMWTDRGRLHSLHSRYCTPNRRSFDRLGAANHSTMDRDQCTTQITPIDFDQTWACCSVTQLNHCRYLFPHTLPYWEKQKWK